MTEKTAPDKPANIKAPRKTCFVIMPISDVEGYPPGHFKEVYDQLILPSVIEAGYECHLATTTSSAHMIQLEVVTKVATADLCICDLSNSNPNVLFEYGLRQAFDKPTVLLKDDKTRRIFDLSGFRDIEYDHTLRISNILKTRSDILKAIKDTTEGATDASQIFSLVKLMRLTKASIPAGDMKPETAQFELLSRKIENLGVEVAKMRKEASESRSAPSTYLMPSASIYTPGVNAADISAGSIGVGYRLSDLTK